MPIERLTPAARVGWMLKDASAALLVTQRSLATELPDGMPPALCLEDVGHTDGGIRDALGPPATKDNLAYVIYTSGSTGNPKGVAVPHGEAVAHLDGIRRAFALDDRDVVLQFASIAFDVGQTVKRGQPLMKLDPVGCGARDVASRRAALPGGGRLKRKAKDEHG